MSLVSSKSAKGTRRPLAVLKVGFLTTFGEIRLNSVNSAPFTVTLNDCFPVCSRHYATLPECLRLADILRSNKTPALR